LGSDGDQDSGNEPMQDGATEEQSNENDWNPESSDNDTLKVLMKSEDWLWNLDNWKMWKAAFREIAERIDDVRIHEVVRSEAIEALEVMEELETL